LAAAEAAPLLVLPLAMVSLPIATSSHDGP